MPTGRQHGRFPTTHWSLVARAGGDDVEARREALERLLARYLPALRAHLIFGKGLSPEDADDVSQDFVAGKVLQNDLIARADRQLGKFRTFLLKALDRFFLNWVRARQAKKRAPGEGAMGLGHVAEQVASVRDTSNAFELTWARGIVHEALRRMKQECETTGRGEVWAVFQCRVVAPLLEREPAVDYDSLVERFGFLSPSQASNVLITAKRMYARTLRAVIGEYSRDDEEVEGEIDDLRRVLSNPRG